MRLAQRKRAVDFEIEADGKLVMQVMDRNVVNREALVPRHDHDPFDDGLVVERVGLRRNTHLRARQFAADRVFEIRFDRGDTVERKRAAHADGDFGEKFCAHLARSHAFDCDHALDVPGERSDPFRNSGRRNIGQ